MKFNKLLEIYYKVKKLNINREQYPNVKIHEFPTQENCGVVVVIDESDKTFIRVASIDIKLDNLIQDVIPESLEKYTYASN